MANGPFWMIIPGERIGTSNGYADANAETSRMYPRPNSATVNLSAVAVTEKRKSKKLFIRKWMPQRRKMNTRSWNPWLVLLSEGLL